MSSMKFADLHCHPTFYGFNRMRNTPAWENSPDVFHPWHELPSDAASMEAGVRATGYTQSSFTRMARGNTRLVFQSFTPIERGFFEGSTTGDDHPFAGEVLRLVSGVTLVRSAQRLIAGQTGDALREAARIIRNDGPLRRMIQSFFLKYSKRRVDHILSDDYDYWDEFLREYAFLRSRDGQTARVEFEHDGKVESFESRYRLVANSQELRDVMERSDRDIAVILTIEGAHVFSIGTDQKPVPVEVMLERIGTMRELPHPIFFVTLAHHFDNGLCGHAHSLVDSAAAIMDQKARMNEDFEREGELGVRIVRELLDLDENLDDRGGKRILIDVKHMSARTRKSYYAEIVEPYNARHPGRSAAERRRYPKVPVIMSHAGYSGVGTLDELIAAADCENDHWHRPPYYAWNINLCDEDVRMVHQTEGLVGICFDRRICGVAPGQKVPREAWCRVLLNQILGIVDVVMLDDRLTTKQRRTIWNCICIGSDYDGVIDPVAAYPTAMSLPQFAEDLRVELEAIRHTRMIDTIGVDVLLEKICWKNAYDFALRHFPAAAGER